LGRIRQRDIKNVAQEIVRRYGDKLSTDFLENRKFIEGVVKVQGKFLRNRISGYVTHIMKQKRKVSA
jgi:small subunit ribosomal protein S17e